MTKQTNLGYPAIENKQLAQYIQPEDELNLIDLWCLIKSNKMLLFIGVMFAWLIAGVWFFLSEPVYKAESRLLPAPTQSLAELTVKDPNQRYLPLKVFNQYLRNIQSINNMNRFFNENNLLEYFSLEQVSDDRKNQIFEQRFLRKLSVLYDHKKKQPESVTVTFKLNDPERAADWLNRYVRFVENMTKDEIIAEVNERLAVERKYLQGQIKIKKQTGKQARLDSIIHIEEALLVARKLGISSDVGIKAGKDNTIEVNVQGQPLYSRGVEALSAELDSLKARESDDPFISGLRGLEEKLAELELLRPEWSNISIILIDKLATKPLVGENKKILTTFSMSTLFGIFIGLMLIGIKHFFQRVKNMELQQVAIQ